MLVLLLTGHFFSLPPLRCFFVQLQFHNCNMKIATSSIFYCNNCQTSFSPFLLCCYVFSPLFTCQLISLFLFLSFSLFMITQSLTSLLFLLLYYCQTLAWLFPGIPKQSWVLLFPQFLSSFIYVLVSSISFFFSSLLP